MTTFVVTYLVVWLALSAYVARIAMIQRRLQQ